MVFHRTKETLVTPPAVEPVSLQEMQQHLRVDGQYDGDYIQSLIVAARTQLELYCWSSFISQVWSVWFDRFWWKMYLPYGPVCLTSSAYSSISQYSNPTGIQSFQYVPPQGSPSAYSTVTSTIWETSRENQLTFIRAAYLQTYPITRGFRDDVTVTYITGYGDTPQSVPTPIRQAIKLLVTQLYLNRGETTAEIPQAIRYMIEPYRMKEF